MGTSEGARKGWTEESRVKRAEAMRLKWADPEYRAKRTAVEVKPETKENRSRAMQVVNSDPERTARHSETMTRKFAEDSEFRARHAEGLRRSWDNPDRRKSLSEAMKALWLETPEVYEGSLEALRDSHKDPAWRERRRTALLKFLSEKPPTVNELRVAQVISSTDRPYRIHAIREGFEMDLFIPALNMNIEVDGGNHYGVNRAKDAQRDQTLVGLGYEVLRIPHASIEDGSYVDKIFKALAP